MGSILAGVKAGTLGGALYAGGLAAFNIAMWYLFKGEALSQLGSTSPGSCPPNNSTALQACFNLVASWYVPLTAFYAFFVVLFFAALFGWSYESFPGRSPAAKGEVIAALVALGLVLGDLYGFVLGPEETALLAAFFVGWTAVFGYAMGRLYRRYTRLVRFESADVKLVKVLVDGKDYTGRSRTFARTTTHEVRAKLAEGASFREWTVSGGVSVEDPRSFETLMEVNGDGLLKAQGFRKR
jgi:hypothetical protein